MAQLKSGSTAGGSTILTAASAIGFASVSGSSTGNAATATRALFSSVAAEGATKNEGGVISTYATGVWKQVYPAVYS